MKTKIILSLIGITGAILLTGCNTYGIEYDGRSSSDIEVIIQQVPTPPKIQTHSMQEYKKMSFKKFLKNIYAVPVQKYSSTYLIDCRTLSNNKSDFTSLCRYSFVKGRWMKRIPYWQKQVDAKLDAVINNDIKNELNRYCIAKGGFIEKNAGIAKCKINNKVFYQYKTIFSRHNTGLQIKYFNLSINNLSIDDFLKSYGAIKLAENKYDVSSIIKNKLHCDYFILGERGCGTNMYYILASFYDDLDLEAKSLNVYINNSNLELEDKFINKIASILTQNEEADGDIAVYIHKKKIIAVIAPKTKHLFLIDDETRSKINKIIRDAQQIKKYKNNIKREQLNY